MSLPKFLQKDKEAKTPIILKISLIFIGWLTLAALVKPFTISQRAIENWSSTYILSIILNAFGFICIIGAWNLKKWAPLGLLFLSLLSLALVFFSEIKIDNISLVAGVILATKLFPLIPYLIYWKRMSWK